MKILSAVDNTPGGSCSHRAGTTRVQSARVVSELAALVDGAMSSESWNEFSLEEPTQSLRVDHDSSVHQWRKSFGAALLARLEKRPQHQQHKERRARDLDHSELSLLFRCPSVKM